MVHWPTYSSSSNWLQDSQLVTNMAKLQSTRYSNSIFLLYFLFNSLHLLVYLELPLPLHLNEYLDGDGHQMTKAVAVLYETVTEMQKRFSGLSSYLTKYEIIGIPMRDTDEDEEQDDEDMHGMPPDMEQHFYNLYKVHSIFYLFEISI